MTYAEINAMVGNIGLPYEYYQFPEKTGQEPPFICWMTDGIDDLYADNINYQTIARVIIEFYSDRKDFTNEQTIETVLTGAGLTYAKEETYLDSEHMHETIYTMEVVING